MKKIGEVREVGDDNFSKILLQETELRQDLEQRFRENYENSLQIDVHKAIVGKPLALFR